MYILYKARRKKKSKNAAPVFLTQWLLFWSLTLPLENIKEKKKGLFCSQVSGHPFVVGSVDHAYSRVVHEGDRLDPDGGVFGIPRVIGTHRAVI